MPQKPRLCRFQNLGPHGFHQIGYTEWGDPHNERIVAACTDLTAIAGISMLSPPHSQIASALCAWMWLAAAQVIG